MPYAPKTYRPPRLKVPPKVTNPLYLSKEFRAQRIHILQRDKYTCQICGVIVTGRDAHVDHIQELADGGDPLAAWNLRVLCARCNGRKAANSRHARERRG